MTFRFQRFVFNEIINLTMFFTDCLDLFKNLEFHMVLCNRNVFIASVILTRKSENRIIDQLWHEQRIRRSRLT